MDEKIRRELHVGLDRLQQFWLDQAEGHFRTVLAAEPDHPGALHLLGITLCKLGRADEGISLIRRGIRLNSGLPSIQYDVAGAMLDLAVALRDSGQHSAAEMAHGEAVALGLARKPQKAVADLNSRVFSVEHKSEVHKIVDYNYRVRVRYGAGRPAHAQLATLIGDGRQKYVDFLDKIANYRPEFETILPEGNYAATTPFWFNTWFAPLDAMALHTVICCYRPRLFVEIGSGMSTKFAKRAIIEHRIGTRMVSIDPQPRNVIDSLVDQNVRAPLEGVDLRIFDELGAGDIVFLDSSHRSFQNSDVTTFFLEVLPRLKAGVFVHIHDIYLPFDYPSGHVWRLWNEQYLLATALIYGSRNFEIIFPSWYVVQDPELSTRMNERLRQGSLHALHIHGTSFWLQKTAS